ISSSAVIHISHLQASSLTAKQRPVLMTAVKKACELHLTHSNMNDWTGDDLGHFVDAVLANKTLRILDLSHNHLADGMQTHSRFDLIKRLIEAPVSTLDLSHNDMGKLKGEPMEALRKAAQTATRGEDAK